MERNQSLVLDAWKEVALHPGIQDVLDALAERAKAVTRGINDRCRRLRPHAELLVDGFGIPEQLRYAEMLHPEHIPDADEHTPQDATSAGVI